MIKESDWRTMGRTSILAIFFGPSSPSAQAGYQTKLYERKFYTVTLADFPELPGDLIPISTP